ncbi:nuclear transport factor 2 family protein [Streptomyces yerevanensis]|uniref:nuclear transport factor 2 family protein n=1 Tax=Streptomyces yerevanensis TaxID=66378 RepID=UPI000A99191D|nr:nuclear transport factor 2 family protein [Streptomyces yerevanensis]
MQLLDAGEVDAWAETFTPDAVFDSNSRPRPSVGRETIRANTARAVAACVHQGVTCSRV